MFSLYLTQILREQHTLFSTKILCLKGNNLSLSECSEIRLYSKAVTYQTYRVHARHLSLAHFLLLLRQLLLLLVKLLRLKRANQDMMPMFKREEIAI